MASESPANLVMDDSLDILGDIKLDGPSESESSGVAKEHSCTEQPRSTDVSTDLEQLLEVPNPSFHPAVDPPYCDRCSVNHNNTFFSLKCLECQNKLQTASIGQIFAIMRQWSSSIQTSMMFYIEKVFKHLLHQYNMSVVSH